MDIKYARKRRGISQKELAAKLGISASYLCELEKNKKHNPKIALIKHMSKILEVPINELIERRAG